MTNKKNHSSNTGTTVPTKTRDSARGSTPNPQHSNISKRNSIGFITESTTVNFSPAPPAPPRPPKGK
jgi:hypothetical protein